MIKIRFLENNKFLVRYNGNPKDIFSYLATITTKFIYCAKPNIAVDGGWIFHYNKLQDVLEAFNHDVVYENTYTPPVYANIGKNMLLQPYDYQKEAIHFAINTKEALLVLPCGAGKKQALIM